LYTLTLDFSELGTLGLRSYLYGAIDPGEHLGGVWEYRSNPWTADRFAARVAPAHTIPTCAYSLTPPSARAGPRSRSLMS